MRFFVSLRFNNDNALSLSLSIQRELRWRSQYPRMPKNGSWMPWRCAICFSRVFSPSKREPSRHVHLALLATVHIADSSAQRQDRAVELDAVARVPAPARDRGCVSSLAPPPVWTLERKPDPARDRRHRVAVLCAFAVALARTRARHLRGSVGDPRAI